MKKILTVMLLTAIVLASQAQSIPHGKWTGRLTLNRSAKLGLVLNISADPADKPTVTLDSPDQNAYGIPALVKFLSEDSINVSVSKIGVSFQGHIAGDCMSGTFRQGFARLPLTLNREEVRRPQTPVPPFPYTTQEVRFQNVKDSVTLAGTLTIPENSSKKTPVVVMVTGSGLQNRDEELFGHKPFAVIADYLARNGVASLRYDDRGYGQSTGNGRIATTTDFAADAAAAVEYLKSLKQFGKVGVLGHSEGGSITFILGAKKIPDFIIGMGAPLSPGYLLLAAQSAVAMQESGLPAETVGAYTSALLKLYPTKIRKGNETASAYVDEVAKEWPDTPIYKKLIQNLRQIAALSDPWLDEFIAYDPADNIKAAKCPALMLYGELDTQVSPQVQTPAIEEYLSKKQVKIYPGLNHLMQHCATGAVKEYGEIEETISPEVLADILEFVKKVK